MTKRILISPFALLLCSGLAIAQVPAELPIAAPKSAVESTNPSPLVSNAPPIENNDGFLDLYGDFALAWIRGTRLPTLVSTSPVGTARASAGVLGTGATPLFGGRVDENVRAGFSLGFDWWFSAVPGLGINAGSTMLESQAKLFFDASNGSPILARPYIDSTTGLQQAVLVAFPGSSTGSIAVRAESANFYEAHLDLMENTFDAGWYRLTSLFGYRFYSYNENLRITQNLAPTGSSFVTGTHVISNDSFGTHNEFHGLDLGFRNEFIWDSVSLEFLSKIAFARMHSTVAINGSQLTSVPGTASVSSSGGVYALDSNIGTYHIGHLRALPEVGVSLKWQVTSYLQLRTGYSLMVLDGVAHAGDQVDQVINPANFSPTSGTPAAGSRPAFNFRSSEVWIQSVTIGAVLTF